MSKKSKTSEQPMTKREEAAMSNDMYMFENQFDPLGDLNFHNSHHIDAAESCCTKGCCLKLCKQFITFMISRVGLMIVMVSYVLLGGVIFEALESENEKRALKLSESVLEKMLTKIYKQIENNSTRIKDEAFYIFLSHEIRTFGEFFTNGSLNGTLTGNIEAQWDFFGSVFYCVTLVSTIGYGHITCKTRIGKVFTIIYSAIGIPLMMLFLANTGSSTATMFKFFYLRISTIKRKLKTRRLNRLYCQRLEVENEFAEEYGDFNNKNYLYYGYNQNGPGAANISRNGSKKSSTPSSFRQQSSFKKTKNNSSFKKKPKVSMISESPLVARDNQIALRNNNSDIYDELQTKQANKQTTKKQEKTDRMKLKKQSEISNEISSISFGIRSVDIPHELINLAVIKTPVVDPYPSIAKITETFNRQMMADVDFDLGELDPGKLTDAMKRIDDLLEQKSISEEAVVHNFTDSIENLPKQLAENNAEKSLPPLSQSDLDYEEEDKLNSNYLISDIFAKNSLRGVTKMAKKIENERYEMQTVGKVVEAPKPVVSGGQKSELILKIQDKNDPISNRTKSISEQCISDKKTNRLKGLSRSLKMFNSRKKPIKDELPKIEEPIQEVSMSIQSDKKRGDELVMSSQDPDQENTENDATTNRKLRTIHSSPGFDSKSVNSDQINENSPYYKRNFNRSVNSYDYAPNSKNSASRRNMMNYRSNRNMPMYSTKQLHLIYSQYKQERQEKMGVPMLTALLIITLYLVCGMMIFSSFENWSKLDALYFCFITLSTIGFGDILPGSTLMNINKSGNKNNLYISALYIFIGLILIAMCINLVKNQLKYKIKSIARKFGLSSTTDH